MTPRNVLTSLLVIMATVIGVLLLSGNPIHLATVVKVVLIAAMASAIVQWFNVRKAARG